MHRLDAEIPPSQAAYRQGGCTNENAPATGILGEKAITSHCYTIHLLSLDIS